MRTIAIGDIHGCQKALESILTAINPTSDDTIITLGDYVDRGPDSKGVIETMLSLQDKCTLIPLCGNHELMMMRSFEDRGELKRWLMFGGRQTLDSYGIPHQGLTVQQIKPTLTNIPREHMLWIANCKVFHETDDFIFVHANYEADKSMDEQLEDFSFWKHLNTHIPEPHQSGKTVFVGHTPQDGIADLGHIVGIDTYAFGGGFLTALDVNTRQTWQANKEGELL